MGVGPDSPGGLSSRAFQRKGDYDAQRSNEREPERDVYEDTQRRMHESALRSHNSGFRSGDGGKTVTADDFTSGLPDHFHHTTDMLSGVQSQKRNSMVASLQGP